MFGLIKKDAKSAEFDVPTFEKVDWKRDRNMRRLYFWCAILCIASANNGYDG